MDNMHLTCNCSSFSKFYKKTNKKVYYYMCACLCVCLCVCVKERECVCAWECMCMHACIAVWVGGHPSIHYAHQCILITFVTVKHADEEYLVGFSWSLKEITVDVAQRAFTLVFHSLQQTQPFSPKLLQPGPAANTTTLQPETSSTMACRKHNPSA